MLAALLAAVVVGIAVGRPQRISDVPIPIDLPEADDAAYALGLVVHVSGQVVNPGLVEVPADSRVAAVIAAAGGTTAEADLDRVNLAEPVRDGQQVVVPSRSDGGGPPTPTDGGDARVRVNDADASALETLPGVGPVLASKILSYRDEYGPFMVVEDLLDVPGIGEQKLASLRDHVIVP